jgi:hypothetical protein
MEHLRLIELTGRLLGSLVDASSERKIEVAGYLDEMAISLAEVQRLARAEGPEEELSDLAVRATRCALRFRDATSGVIGEQDSELFSVLVEQAHNVKGLWLEQRPRDRDELLRSISQVARGFRIMAATLRGSPSVSGR